MNKYALCLSGQPRFFREGFRSLEKNLFKPNGGRENFDIFIHSWYDKNKIGSKFDAAPWNVDTIETIREGIDEEIVDLYEPKVYFFEPERNWKLVRNYRYKGDQEPHIPFSMFYSVLESNNLRRGYSTDSGITYERVLRSRFDFALDEEVILEKYDKAAVYLHNNQQTHKGATSNSYNDWFAIMNSINADIYADTFFHIDDFYVQGIKHNQECTLGAQLRKNRVLVQPTNFKCHLIRGNE